MEKQILQAAETLAKSKYAIAFTGAGVSVESGIPPFRGEAGLWNKYDPRVLDLGYFYEHPEECWHYIRQIFYDFFAGSKPNTAHLVLAEMEHRGLLKSVVTQNIDNLHYEAGSKTVYEFHGNSKQLVCRRCGKITPVSEIDLKNLPPRCPGDGTILKPDFIFFGEGIPPEAYEMSFIAAKKCDVCLIVGSTGEVAPASYIPKTAKEYGATIIEINPEESMFTNQITDIYLKGRAGEVMGKLGNILFKDL
jgi:NAD-dependent deacetylase